MHDGHGMENQTLEVVLQQGQAIHAENGAMSFMEEGIVMSTGTGWGRGPFALFKRRISGESILISIFTNQAGQPQRLGVNGRIKVDCAIGGGKVDRVGGRLPTVGCRSSAEMSV